MGWIDKVNQQLGQRRQGTPQRQNKMWTKPINRELGQSQKKTWACTGCSVIALLAALALCWGKHGSEESFIPAAFSTEVLLAGWKADALGNQEKASGCGLLVLWIFLLIATVITFIGVAATS